jgi:hypothetical protein
MIPKETIAMAKRKRPKHETRYQRIHRLMKDGECGLLPFDFSCPCPRRGGPEVPHPEHPGLVGFLTCRGCTYNTDLYFDSRVCTHPNAQKVAARWLADTIKAWHEQQALQTQPTLF